MRAVAAASGGDCDAERQGLNALAGALQIGADQSGTAGRPIEFAWIGGGTAGGAPAWLVVAVEGPVRFTG